MFFFKLCYSFQICGLCRTMCTYISLPNMIRIEHYVTGGTIGHYWIEEAQAVLFYRPLKDGDCTDATVLAAGCARQAAVRSVRVLRVDPVHTTEGSYPTGLSCSSQCAC